MKKCLLLISIICIFAMCSCSMLVPEIKQYPYDGYEYLQSAELITPENTPHSADTGVITDTEPAGDESFTGESDMPQSEDEASETDTEQRPEITTEKKPESEPTPQTPPVTEVDLSISMPEKNGDMYFDKTSSNKYIQIVHKNKGIDTGLLVAVFAVPDSGQNYVFEFYNKSGRSVDDLRRVYLIDINGDITGIAASDSSEKEGVSSVENWFCMNVLIKEIIFPAIESKLN